MRISIYIDNNVWDFLFDRKLDLSAELPREEFCLCLTREAEFEIPPIPIEKADLKNFIEETIKRCTIETRPYFGFYDDNHTDTEQRVAGFDEGHWVTKEEHAFIEQQQTRLSQKEKPKTRLYKNEADISIAARSFHSVVITLDKKAGAINDAYKKGGKVVFLNDFRDSGLSLKDFISNQLADG
jgi:hypothetical protein